MIVVPPITIGVSNLTSTNAVDDAVFSLGTTYTSGQARSLDGIRYVCATSYTEPAATPISGVAQHHPSTSPTYWVATGWKATYDEYWTSGTTTVLNKVVIYGNALYKCILSYGSNTLPTNTTYWVFLCYHNITPSWVNNQVYNAHANEVVMDVNGNRFLCVTTHSSNTSTSLNDSALWFDMGNGLTYTRTFHLNAVTTYPIWNFKSYNGSNILPTSYSVGDIVTDGYLLYRCITAHTNTLEYYGRQPPQWWSSIGPWQIINTLGNYIDGTNNPFVVSASSTTNFIGNNFYGVAETPAYRTRVYQCLQSYTEPIATSYNPALHPPSASPTYWTNTGPVNSMAMFDTAVTTSTTAVGGLRFKVSAGRFTSIGFMGIVGTAITITIREGAGGSTIYTESRLLVSSADNFYGFVFEDLLQTKEAYFYNLPSSPNAEVEVVISGLGTVECGLCVMGNQFYIGQAQYNFSLAVEDRGRHYLDKYNNPVSIERGYSKGIQCNIVSTTKEFNRLVNFFAENIGVLCLWIATPDQSDYISTTTFGRYTRAVPVIVGPSQITAALDIAGNR